MRKSALLTCSLVLALAAGAEAAPLNLTLNPSPDITSQFIDLSYVAATDSLSVDGYNVTIDDDNAGPLIDFDDAFTALNFNIDATVDDFGNASAGTLSVSGDLTSSLGISGLLLTGDLVLFGFDSQDPGSGLDFFEFVFEVTGGQMATFQYFGTPGSFVGVIYDPFENVFDGTWGSSFSSFNNGSSHTDLAPVPIPEPATLSLMLLAGVSLLRPLRRR
ncbi:MAG TPA: hypothetical protein VJZ71_12285 [Phycisphaerae bacterium]|nr:hypothetical protein [Phycisphaerae bacterium]